MSLFCCTTTALGWQAQCCNSSLSSLAFRSPTALPMTTIPWHDPLLPLRRLCSSALATPTPISLPRLDSLSLSDEDTTSFSTLFSLMPFVVRLPFDRLGPVVAAATACGEVDGDVAACDALLPAGVCFTSSCHFSACLSVAPSPVARQPTPLPHPTSSGSSDAKLVVGDVRMEACGYSIVVDKRQ